ncbi:MAG: cell division protein SepF [Defluviitaleaceae bacterium]|nr:cell division protein SepF [Defluviitaleaceae bacterium]
MIKDFFVNVKDKLRSAMLSPGFDNYDPDEEMEMEDDYLDEPVIVRAAPSKEETWQSYATRATAPKSTLQQAKYNDKIVELYGKKTQVAVTAQVALTSPKDVSSSNIVTDYIKEGKICAVNLTGVERGQAQRIVDVVAGGVYALNGSINRVSKDIFIVAPEGVQVSGELKEELSHWSPWTATR